jgi:endo-1,4-beta-xylanase
MNFGIAETSKNFETMKINIVFILAVVAILAGCDQKQAKDLGLKDALEGKFYIGAALNEIQISGGDSNAIAITKLHFNTITAENCMKSERIQPNEGVFSFGAADSFVQFGIDNNMHIVGHCLVWHSQTPRWFFTDSIGNEVTREVLIQRIKTHIETVVSRYKGKVHGWDVVNEAIEDDGSWRQSKFFKIIGEEYIELAFQFAHNADPDAELYYNDYSMAHQGRRNAVVEMVKRLKDKGIRIDGVGMQGHMTMTFPTFDEYEKSILAFAEQGVKVMITELDMTILPWPEQRVTADIALSAEYKEEMNPYPNGMPDSVATAWHNRYAGFFDLFLKHHDKISRVTLWGVHDEQSWRNNWPIFGRTDYPVLFDRNYQPKPVVQYILEQAVKAKK